MFWKIGAIRQGELPIDTHLPAGTHELRLRVTGHRGGGSGLDQRRP